MQENQHNEVFLRPRFSLCLHEAPPTLIERFRKRKKDPDCRYHIKIVGSHIVVDIPAEDHHFWSPQLALELEDIGDGQCLLRGLFGPKPAAWTLFMFIHFALAVAFIGFSVAAYVKWLVKEDHRVFLVVAAAFPVCWILLYIIGRMGKRKGRGQMGELRDFMQSVLGQ